MTKATYAFVALAIISAAVPALSEPLKVEAVMTPKEQIQLNFKDGSNHFVLMVRREGQAAGVGPLAGASVVEYGMHDIIPGVGGNPVGYLVFTATNGDIAYIQWQVGAVFVPGPEGKPQLLDNGFWKIVSGTGSLQNLVGAGTLHIRAVSPSDRKFILDGEVVLKK